MPVMLKSSDVQQNFGKVMEQALTQEDIIVERYGEPRVAILSYQRYQQLLQHERNDADIYLAPPQASADAKEQGQAQAQQIRQTLQAELDASLDEVMASLRGRAWLS
jgi:PHD/YefM family antitoxin component YafN of YafNO toxin-antitoxin module